MYIIQDKCLDCGVEKTLGYDFCLSCGSKFESQKGRTRKEQRIFNKKIKKKEHRIKKEFKTRVWQKKKEKIRRDLSDMVNIIMIFLIISIVTGIIGLVIGGGWGFLIGFLAPLIMFLIYVEISD
ncbi:MAG: hypothetical protein ACFFDN_40620 [Candidatus Hodarchaeota archaeon]